MASTSGIVPLNIRAAIPTSNSFQLSETHMDTTPFQTQANKEKPPPMVVEQVTSSSNLCQSIIQYVNKERFSTKIIAIEINRNINVKISLSELEDYRIK